MKTMQKTLCMIVSLTCILALLTLVASATTAIEGRKTVEVLRVDPEKTTITIDGEIDEIWKGANAVKIDTLQTDTADAATVTPGVNCATGTVKLLWNGSNVLYMLFEVVDDDLAAVSINPWENDAVQFFTDWTNEGNNVNRCERIVYDYGVGSGAAYEYATKETDTGYLIEISLITEPYNHGDYIGLDFEIDDGNPDGLRTAAIGWSYDKNNGWQTSAGYGQGLLSGTEAQIPVDEPEQPEDPAPETADMLSVAVVVFSLATVGIVISKKRQNF